MTRLEQLQKLALIAPDDPMSHYGLGLEFVNLQDWNQAIAAFRKATTVDGKYSAAYYHQAKSEIAAGRNDDARATLAVGMQTAKAVGDWHTESEMRELLGTIE